MAARCWIIVLDEAALPAEEEFLRREVYGGRAIEFRRDKITARNRFSLTAHERYAQLGSAPNSNPLWDSNPRGQNTLANFENAPYKTVRPNSNVSQSIPLKFQAQFIPTPSASIGP